MDLEYHLLDVFTDRAFGGNPLAVVVEPPPLEAAQMQALAREFNLSETVFVGPTDPDGAWRTRIFTPGTELPFAGHPTVGTAVLLALLGHATDRVVLREGIGDVACELTSSGDASWSATFTTATLPEPFDTASPSELAAALGLTDDDLHPAFVAGGYSCGVPFSMLPVRTIDTLARCQVRGGDFQIFVVAPADTTYTRWRARMFAPAFGIAEDPATGSAAAAFAGLLVASPATAGVDRVVIEQGIEMGRPSTINLSLTRDRAGALQRVQVGGSAVLVGQGRIRAR